MDYLNVWVIGAMGYERFDCNYSLQVAFYPSFQMIVNSPVLIFTLLFDEIHSKWMNHRRMKVYRLGMKFSRREQLL